MKRARKLLTYLLSTLMVLPFGISPVFAAEVVDQSNTDTYTNQGIIDDNYGYLAQSFTPSVSGYPSRIDLPLCISGNPGSLGELVNTELSIVDFDSNSNTPLGDTMAYGSFTNMATFSDCGSGYSNVSFTFNPIQTRGLVAGKQYAILLRGSANNSPDISLRWGATNFNGAVGNLHRRQGLNNFFFDDWTTYAFSGGFTEYINTDIANTLTPNQGNTGTVTNAGVINTRYGELVQPFTPSVSGPLSQIDLPLCITGDPAQLNSYTFAAVRIFDYDTDSETPIGSVLASSSGINMSALPDCSVGFGTASVWFPAPFSFFPGMPANLPSVLVAGRKYGISLQASNFNDADHTLQWAGTGLNATVGSMSSSPDSEIFYNTWTANGFSAVFQTYIDTTRADAAVIDQSNTTAISAVGVLNNPYGYLAQPFVASRAEPVIFAEIPVCVTGDQHELNSYVFAAVDIVEFDEINNVPTHNIVSQGTYLVMPTLPDCSSGYTKAGVQFFRDFDLTVGKKYALTVQTSNFNNADHTLQWAATGEVSSGSMYSDQGGSGWVAIPGISGHFKEYTLSEVQANLPPTVDAGGPYSVNEGSTVLVSATGNDPESQALSYDWDLDDNGSFETSGQAVNFSAASLLPGVYNIHARVTDVGSLTATDSATVTVNDVPTYDDFVLLGNDGVWLKQGVTVSGGDVGASVQASGPFLDSGVEVSIGQNVSITNITSTVFGDSIKLKSGSTVQDVEYNDIANNGTILGTQTTPRSLPVVPGFPAVPTFTAGTTDVNVPANGSQSLAAGSYKDLTVLHDAILTFSGGVYNFNSWDIRDDVKLYFSAATEVRIAGRLDTNTRVEIVPAVGSGITAADIKIFVTGINGGSGNIGATPKAVNIGSRNIITANIFAANGTLFIREQSTATGAFLGKWVVIGENSDVNFVPGF